MPLRAAQVGSAALDALEFAGELGEDLPGIKPLLNTLKAIREKIENVRRNREELEKLHRRCAFITKFVIDKYRRSDDTSFVIRLKECIEEAKRLVDRCAGRGKWSTIIHAAGDRSDMTKVNALIDQLSLDLDLALTVRWGETLSKCQTKLAMVPNGTPKRKSWHVERSDVIRSVFQALTSDGGPQVVGLVGESGSGKTTTASEVVRSTEVQKVFCDGIVWLSVNKNASACLPSLMLQLARMVYEDILGGVGRPPAPVDDGASFVKQRMESGNGLKCLVVADNVWEKEVVTKLSQTSMWVLLSTRDQSLVTSADGTTVVVDKLSQKDAESVLKRAADLDPRARLPDASVELIKLCDGVAMDLAFVGRWSCVRHRRDPPAWSDAAQNIRAEMEKVKLAPSSDSLEDNRATRRRAILKVGFEQFFLESDDERVQRLYLSLAVMPDGHRFSVSDAAILLYDRTPSDDDEAAVLKVLDVLERWTVIRSVDGGYHMHDAHSSFAREGLRDRRDIRRPALERGVRSVSTLHVLRTTDQFVLKDLWRGIEGVGGLGWAKVRPYEAALITVNKSDSVMLRQHMRAVARFQQTQEDWEGSRRTLARLLEADKENFGADHPNVLSSLRSLAKCSARLGHSEEAAGWREEEGRVLPIVLARMQDKADCGQLEHGGGTGGLWSVVSSTLKLAPDDRAEAEDLLRRSLEIQETTLGREDVQVARTLHCLGVFLKDSGRLTEAKELLRRCLKIREAKLGEQDVRVANTLYHLGVCIRYAGGLDEADELLRRSLVIREAKLGPDDVQVAYVLHSLALCFALQGRLEDARKCFERSVRIQETKVGPESVEVATTLHFFGVSLRRAGQWNEAEQVFERCLAIRETKLGDHHVEVANTVCQLAECAKCAGKLEMEESWLRRHLAIVKATHGKDDVKVAHALHALGASVAERGRLEEGIQLLRKSLSIEETKGNPNGIDVAMTLYHLGAFLRLAGRLKEAQEVLRRALWIRETTKLSQEPIHVALTLRALGVAVGESGSLEEAEDLLRRCLEIAEGGEGSEDLFVAYALHDLGVCVSRAGRIQDAEEFLRRSLVIKKAKRCDNDSAQVAITLHHLALCARSVGDHRKAEGLLRECLMIKEANLGRNDIQVASALYHLGVVLRNAKKLDEAEELLIRCLAIQEATLKVESLGMAKTFFNLGICVRDAGRLKEAAKLLKKCLRIEQREGVHVDHTLYHLGVCLRLEGRYGEAEYVLRRCLRIREGMFGLDAHTVSNTLKQLDACLRLVGRPEKSRGFDEGAQVVAAQKGLDAHKAFTEKMY